MFSNVSLMPHAVCWAAAPRLVWTMVVTNAITFLSYVTICLTLLLLARGTRRVIARDWAYFVVGFALFIVACGSTHLLEVITTWKPIFWVDAWTNIITAFLSAWVAINFVRRSSTIGFGINDYAERLNNTEREKLRMEQSLLAAQRLEEWSRMSTVLAHEISNPMEAIQNVLYLVRSSRGVSPEVAKMAAAAELEAGRVVEISRSTLSFFRQSSQPEPIDLREVADSVRFLVARLIERKRINFEVLAAGSPVIHAYPVEVRQALLNLVRNACEAVEHEGARVAIELKELPHGVEMVVSDEGPGIEARLLPTLFQFGASTKGADGNGMGLWTVHHIVGHHGGTVTVSSAPGAGTRFVLLWPRQGATESSEGLASALRTATI